MPIQANVTNNQITATVGETKIDVSVSGGFGPSGTAGAAGQSATIAVGAVTTGAPGSSASVVNSGTSSAAVLDFTIPAGASGAAGPQGATGPAGTTTWAGITDKPSTFAPSSHQHVAADITDFTTAVVAAAPPTTNASLLTSGTLPDARLSSNIARTSDVTAAVAAVIDAAPASLDTLNELAAALGDDANFASTVTNALAAKAPLASPTFTGTVSGVTKAMVGLGNVQNVDATARANHTGTQAATTITGLATVATSGSASDLGSGTISNARLPTELEAFSFTAKNGGGQTGVVVSSTLGIYGPAATWSGNIIDVTKGGTSATTASAARANLGLVIGTNVAAASHTHAWSTITSTPTTLAGYGITDAVASSDARLTDARTPTSHKSSHATGGSDALTAADIGAAAVSHTHSAEDLTSGTVATARLGSGTANSTTFLRGDQTWATVTSGSTNASDLTSGTLNFDRLPDEVEAATDLYLWSSFR